MKIMLPVVGWVVYCLIGPACYAQNRIAPFIDSLLLKAMKPDDPGGVVMVAQGNSIIYKKAFGGADEDMTFGIGSNTKQFTAVSILQLFERGKLSLEDTLGKFISCAPPRGSITIRQLLAQISGLGERIDSPMHFTPGTKWEYNNENYQLLGAIIGKVSGLTYADYLQKNIFRPSGMIHSKGSDSGAYAAGGIYSTMMDMFKWNQALKTGKLLKPGTLQLAFNDQTLQNGDKTAYGFGWRLGELHGSLLRWHGGLITGYASETFYFPGEDVYVVTFIHSDTSKMPLLPLTRIIGATAIGKPYRFTKVPADTGALRLFTGVYEDHAGFLLNISLENGDLFFQRPNGHKYPITYAGNQECFFDKDYLRIRFMKDSTGEINRLIFSQVDVSSTEWTKTAMPPLKLAPEAIPATLLKQYAGKYILGTNDTLTINIKGPALILHMPDRSSSMLIAETDKLYYSLKGDIRIEFSSPQGSLLLYRGQVKEAATKISPAQ